MPSSVRSPKSPVALAPSLAPSLALGLALSLALGLPGRASAQGPPGDYVELKAYTHQDVYHPGATARIAVEMRIDGRVHINSNAPEDEFAIPTSLVFSELPAGVELSDIRWPTPESKAFEFTEGRKIPVFEGRQRAYFEARIPADTPPGALRLRGRFRAQGCTHTACYAPQTDELTVTLRVVPADEEAMSINESKFSETT